MADPAPRIIIVHTSDHMRAALKAASSLRVPVMLQSAPDAIFYAGGLYLLELYRQAKKFFPQCDAVFVIDCGEANAEAVGAMQSGHTHVRSSALPAMREKLTDIAQSCGATLLTRPCDALDLHGARDPDAACREWLAGGA